MNQLTAMAAAALTIAATTMTSCNDKKSQRVNPFIAGYETEYEIPPFDQIQYSDYLPAFEAGIAEAQAQIDSIVANPEAPTFDNTILAMDRSGKILERVSLVFNALSESNSCDEMNEIAEKAMPLVSQFDDATMMNAALFDRVKALYDNRDSVDYTTAQRRAIEQTYKNFTRNGALLDSAGKAQLTDLNLRLTDLYLKFNKNLLEATNSFELVVDNEEQLAGIPANVVAKAAETAAARGKEGKWVFTLHAPSRLPVLQFADNRDLRQAMYNGYTTLASTGATDNRPVINEILKARSAKARLLGYDDFAAYCTDAVMAKTPAAAEELIMKVWPAARKRVDEEVADMQAIVDNEGGGFKIEPWDYYYYAEKVRKAKYDLDENELRPYFAVDSVRKGIFTLANRLYGVTFTEMPDAPKYHPDVNVYNVTDSLGNHVAVFMTDYFPRDSKRQGAWMYIFKEAYTDENGKQERPIVYNIGNFTSPTADTPSLLNIDEVHTMFHEFGHGLHGMLTRAAYKSQSGTNVDRDFVELPSQMNEHFAFEPELMKEYARHYQTGELIPEELVAKIAAASTHNAGFDLVERLGASWLDLQYGHLNLADGETIDVEAFEKEVGDKLGMPSQIRYRYRSPYFKHIFGSNEYASGYYTYLWAEVLDTDAFEMFKENGIFDHATAAAFLNNVLEMGGSDDPMVLYERFRGHKPTPDALMRHYNLK
ncbi:MAG: M3 family metallopeptidase [Clostridiales bacterium]|nr:M3 family metallopeptidase [Clostridiales bacterium]